MKTETVSEERVCSCVEREKDRRERQMRTSHENPAGP